MCAIIHVPYMFITLNIPSTTIHVTSIYTHIDNNSSVYTITRQHTGIAECGALYLTLETNSVLCSRRSGTTTIIKAFAPSCARSWFCITENKSTNIVPGSGPVYPACAIALELCEPDAILWTTSSLQQSSSPFKFILLLNNSLIVSCKVRTNFCEQLNFPRGHHTFSLLRKWVCMSVPDIKVSSCMFSLLDGYFSSYSVDLFSLNFISSPAFCSGLLAFFGHSNLHHA